MERKKKYYTLEELSQMPITCDEVTGNANDKELLRLGCLKRIATALEKQNAVLDEVVKWLKPYQKYIDKAIRTKGL